MASLWEIKAAFVIKFRRWCAVQGLPSLDNTKFRLAELCVLEAARLQEARFQTFVSLEDWTFYAWPLLLHTPCMCTILASDRPYKAGMA